MCIESLYQYTEWPGHPVTCNLSFADLMAWPNSAACADETLSLIEGFWVLLGQIAETGTTVLDRADAQAAYGAA